MATATLPKRKRNFIVQTWDGLSPTSKTVVVGVGALGAYSAYNAIKKNIEENKVKKETEKLTKEFNKPFVITSGSNQGVIEHIDLAKMATDLHNDLHYGLFGMFANSNDVVILLNKVPKPYMNDLEYIYKRVYNGEQLHEQTKKKLSPDQWASVQYLFY